MAVEIPVIIDIDKAFADAANRVSTAIKPLQSSLDGHSVRANITIGNIETSNKQLKEMRDYYQSLEDAAWEKVGSKLDLSPYINQSIMQLRSLQEKLAEVQELRKLEGGRGDFSFAEEYKRINQEINRVVSGITAMQNAQTRLNSTMSSGGMQEHLRSLTASNSELQRMNQYYRELEASSAKMSDSINAIRSRMSDLNAEWNNMTSQERASVRGNEVYKKYKEESRLLKEEALTLERTLQEEKKREELVRRGIQTRRYEKAILDSNVKTIRVLQEQERILTQRLNQAVIGSDNYTKLQERLRGVQAEMKKLQGVTDTATTSFQRQSTVLRQIVSYASTYVSIFGLIRFAKQIRDVTGELEYQRVALGRLIQDEEYGAKLFERIKAAAVESPFRITQLVTYTKQLAAYRIETENLFDTTKRLADVSAGLGVDMDRLILAYGQVRAASVLRGQELRQFTEAGIPLVEMLADKFRELGREGTTTADVFKLISERAVPFSMISEIFEDLTDKGGMFYQMQEKQADTLKGRWEKLKDAYDIALQSLGETKSFEIQNKAIMGLLRFVSNHLNLIPKSIEGITVAWATYNIALALSKARTAQLVSEDIKLAAAQSATAAGATAGTKAHDRLTKAYLAQATASNVLTKSLAKLRIAMLTNPWAVAISGALALATAFLGWRKSVDGATESLYDYSDAIESIASSEKQYAKTGKLIDQYEKLASNTERNAKENLKLNQVLTSLREVFPEIASGIDKENESLDENVRLLRSKNEEERKRGLDQARKEYKSAEVNLGALERQAEDARKKANEAYNDLAYWQLEGKRTESNYSEKYIKRQAEKASEEFDKWNEEARKIDSNIQKVVKGMADLDKYINPEKVEATRAEWQNLLLKMNEYTGSDGIVRQLFSPQDVEGWESLYDASQKMKKGYADAKETYEGLVAAVQSGGKLVRPELVKERDAAQEALNAWNLIKALFGFDWDRSGGRTPQTDPFVTQMQNRIKFMQDFRKGYEDLRKYMSSTDALTKESDVMIGRGLSLGLSSAEQERAAGNLSEWYAEMIELVKKRMQQRGAKGVTVTDLLGLQVSDSNKALKDLQNLLQSLWDAKTDFDTGQMKKNLEDSLKRLSDEIKRSETARNFYENILDLTGDEDLAATLGVSVYGDIGKDFKDRIQRQLEAAFYDLDFSALDDQTFSDLSMAVSTQDFATVLEYIHVFPEEWQKVLREMAADSQKYNADQISNLLKELQSAKSYGEKRVQLARETAQRIAEINQISGITSEEREALLARNAKKEAQEVAKLQYEAFKESPMYVELFANLDHASTQMLRNMRDEILRLNESWKDLDPVQLKEMQSRIKELDEQLARRNPIKALTDALKEYQAIRETYGDRSDVDKKAMDALEEQVNKEKELEEAIKRVAAAEEHYRAVVANKGADSEEAKQAEGLVKSAKATMRARQSAAEAAREAADAAAAEQKKYADIIGDISEGVQGLSEWQDRIDKIADATRDLMETFGANDVDVQFFDDMVQGFSDVLGGATSAATGVAQLMAGDVVGGSMNLISGVAKAAKGISNLIFAPKVHAANKEIEHQAELLSDLEYSYERVSKAMDKAFGNDRIYLMNQKIEQQEAKIAAYQAQLDAENSKGKKKSQDAIEGYENSIRNAKNELQDLKDSVSEYWAGQDLASAAEAFADSWLKAYQEFGSTSDAIKEKMQDMVEGLVKRAALAGVVQAVLKPWYDELGKIESWDAGTVSDMINKAFSMVPMINDGLSVAAGELTAAGVSLRSQVGGFTGISRSIASASEESILALTAGINTQNFYMSYTPLIYDQVAAIAAAMTGGVDPKLSTAGAEAPDMTQQYLSVLPSIDQNVADIKSMLKSVVSPNNTKSATHYVAVK